MNSDNSKSSEAHILKLSKLKLTSKLDLSLGKKAIALLLMEEHKKFMR